MKTVEDAVRELGGAWRKSMKSCESLTYTEAGPDLADSVMSPPADDPVNSPRHYTRGGVECIDAIESALTTEEFRGFCKGNVMKYLWRSQHKGDKIQDEKKAQWYLNRLIKNE